MWAVVFFLKKTYRMDGRGLDIPLQDGGVPARIKKRHFDTSISIFQLVRIFCEKNLNNDLLTGAEIQLCFYL